MSGPSSCSCAGPALFTSLWVAFFAAFSAFFASRFFCVSIKPAILSYFKVRKKINSVNQTDKIPPPRRIQNLQQNKKFKRFLYIKKLSYIYDPQDFLARVRESEYQRMVLEISANADRKSAENTVQTSFLSCQLFIIHVCRYIFLLVVAIIFFIFLLVFHLFKLCLQFESG
jgi:hypothetical protein